jgi:hypothetical protein
LLVARIVVYRAEGLPLDEVYRRIEDEFEDHAPDRSTVARYLKKWDELDAALKQWAVPWRWPDMPPGVPIEASRFLLDCQLVHTRTLSRIKGFPQWPLTAFSPQKAAWAWRVHQADPELDPEDVLWLASDFVWHELASLVLQEALAPKIDGLVDRLRHLPWRDAEHYRRYYDALSDDAIAPPYPLDSEETTWEETFRKLPYELHGVSEKVWEGLHKLRKHPLPEREQEVFEVARTLSWGLTQSHSDRFWNPLLSFLLGLTDSLPHLDTEATRTALEEA